MERFFRQIHLSHAQSLHQWMGAEQVKLAQFSLHRPITYRESNELEEKAESL
jgi:hypothetical protein